MPKKTATGRQGGLSAADDGLPQTAQLLASCCPPGTLAALVRLGARNALRCIVMALGLKGGPEHCSSLVALLQDEDAELAEAAEQSLWRIWMRSGSRWGNGQLAFALELIGSQRLDEALRVLDGLVSIEPEFAEAHHQRGIVLMLLGRPGEAQAAFARALECNPLHFSAAANLGHVYAHRGQLRLALSQYRQALALHPRLDGLGEVVSRLDEIVAR